METQISFKHIGWVTNYPKKFEEFWVDILGFKNIWESKLSSALCKDLFNINCGATCKRYEKNGITIEIHIFDKMVAKNKGNFDHYGLNHICLLVEDRDKFIEEMEKQGIEVHTYNNPKGHQNIFIKDLEGNWIEIYANL